MHPRLSAHHPMRQKPEVRINVYVFTHAHMYTNIYTNTSKCIQIPSSQTPAYTYTNMYVHENIEICKQNENSLSHARACTGSHLNGFLHLYLHIYMKIGMCESICVYIHS